MSNMAITTIDAILVVGDYTLAGRIGGIGPLASIVFSDNSGEIAVVGIDLDKEILLDDPPIELAPAQIRAIAMSMNECRRALVAKMWAEASK